jgi:hypothetical protein
VVTIVDPPPLPGPEGSPRTARDASPGAARPGSGAFKRWLLRSSAPQVQGPHAGDGPHRTHAWWRVMCLTGVDYFSTLGYQPGIAALAAGVLSPIATLLPVLVTLLGALPIYARVARASPRGEGSIAMLERLLPWWQGKLFVLCLLGFVATAFIITITLSAADASAHALENPFVSKALAGQRLGVTLALIIVLGVIFLTGFTEAIGIAVALVVPYLLLNAIVVAVSFGQVVQHRAVVVDWQQALVAEHGDPLRMLAISVLLFPRLALGLSGFETGVTVMPLVRGATDDTPEHPAGRVRNTRRLLLAAVLIMSAFLVASSFVTITLIPADAFQPGGEANGRALAYLAHAYLGDRFGTLYDISTILILAFAGASAMAGLLNIVPRYLPRYGMAPEWARTARPLVCVFTAIAVVVTVVFRADVDAQGGAYATGVLVLMSSAAVAVAMVAWRTRSRRGGLTFSAIALVFAYTTVVNVIERPDGVKIASLFIAGIIGTSLLSRVLRQTELRVAGIALDSTAQRFIADASHGTLHIIAHNPATHDACAYSLKERQQRERNCILASDQVLFLEVAVSDPSEFARVLSVRGEEVGGHHVLRAESATVASAIAEFLLYLRDDTGTIPHAYFDWNDGKPLGQWLRYVLLGHGILRR